MKLILSILTFLIGCLFATISIHNLLTLLIFDAHFILKLFKTRFVHSRFSMICSFFISLFLHATILVGGYFISVRFNTEGFYIVPLVYIFFKGIRQGRLNKHNMLTLFFKKHAHNLDIYNIKKDLSIEMSKNAEDEELTMAKITIYDELLGEKPEFMIFADDNLTEETLSIKLDAITMLIEEEQNENIKRHMLLKKREMLNLLISMREKSTENTGLYQEAMHQAESTTKHKLQLEVRNMLSEKRYGEVISIFEEKGIQLNENDIRLYADVFEVIAHFINDKLTTKEMIEAYDFLSDVILNRRPDTKVHVEKKDRIRVQVALMDKIPFIGDKLDLNEKIMFAFCVYLGECTRIYDEKTNLEKNGIVLFNSIESIEHEFEEYKSFNPSLFDVVVDNKQNEEKEDFGYCKSNPVLTVSVGDSYNYLSRLTSDNGEVTYSRVGSCAGENGHILDIYNITVISRKFFVKKREDYTIYIDAYANSTSRIAPKPFRLK